MARREWVLLGVGIAGMLFGIFGLSGWLLSYDGRQDIDLVSYAQPFQLMPGARMATEDLCSDTVPCIEAVDSDTLTMPRFESAEQVSAVAAMLGGGVRLAGWIVVEFKPGGLSEDEKRNFAAALYCTCDCRVMCADARFRAAPELGVSALHPRRPADDQR
jgi:hypothetical protein